MHSDGHAFGAVGIYSHQKHEWTAEQFRLAEWLADQCARILETLRMQERLRELYAEQQTIFNSSPAMIWYKDTGNNFVRVNCAVAAALGKPLDQIEGHNAHELFPDEAKRYYEDDLEVIHSGQPKLGIVEPLETAGGEKRWVETDKVPYRDEAGEIVGVLLFTVDITERKRAEEVLQQAKIAAEAANEAKGRFLANISHELGTPMNAILGMVDLALAKPIPPPALDFLRTAKESADLLLVLLNDLLDTAKIEAGKLELESAPFSLRRVADQTAQVLTVRASEKGIAFSCHIPSDVPDSLVGDQVRLRQVLLNLAGNAIKFTERGEVTVSVRATQGLGIRDLGLGEEDGQLGIAGSPPLIPNPHDHASHGARIPVVTLEFAVKDTGIGIPSSLLTHVFEPFSQADLFDDPPLRRHRLGIVDRGQPGRPDGRPRLGGKRVGTRQHVPFHRAFSVGEGAAAAAGPAPDVSATAPPRRLRILLVEDNPANQKLAADILQNRGHAVEIAGNGQQAINMAGVDHYDFILMDVQMPGMDGVEATTVIRAREPGGRRVPIIAMTAHAMKGRPRALPGRRHGRLPLEAGRGPRVDLPRRESGGRRSDRGSFPAIRGGTARKGRGGRGSIPNSALERCFNSQKMLGDMTQCFFKDLLHVAAERADGVADRRLEGGRPSGAPAQGDRPLPGRGTGDRGGPGRGEVRALRRLAGRGRGGGADSPARVRLQRSIAPCRRREGLKPRATGLDSTTSAGPIAAGRGAYVSARAPSAKPQRKKR